MSVVISAPTVSLSPRGARRWSSGHPWIYGSDVDVPDELTTGAIVRVMEPRGRCLGQAFFSRESRITLRRVARDEQPVDEGFFRERIAAADALRSRLYPGQDCYRVVHAEADGLPGLVVDRYGDCLAVQFLVAATEQRRELILDVLEQHFRCRAIVNRSDVAVRRLEGLAPDSGVVRGTLPATVQMREGDVRLEVDLLGGQKTGAFLDQRENHLCARDYARGRALDCFSYTGGFALQLAGVAEHVTAIEGSATACERLRSNAAANSIANLEVVCANAFDFLRARLDAGESFDTIVLDPPAFAKQKAALAAGLRGYKEINLRALRLLRSGGYLITCSCSYHVDDARFEAMLAEAAADARRDVQVIERRGAARDHPVLLALRETRYLKCLVLRVS